MGSARRAGGFARCVGQVGEQHQHPGVLALRCRESPRVISLCPASSSSRCCGSSRWRFWAQGCATRSRRTTQDSRTATSERGCVFTVRVDVWGCCCQGMCVGSSRGHDSRISSCILVALCTRRPAPVRTACNLMLSWTGQLCTEESARGKGLPKGFLWQYGRNNPNKFEQVKKIPAGSSYEVTCVHLRVRPACVASL